MRLPLYQVDAFADAVFGGNPAAVCPLPDWLPEPTMQAIAAENNLAETAFFVPQGEGFALRWFTPTSEVDLCGHATLASAFVVMNLLEPGRRQVAFATRVAGTLTVEQAGNLYVMQFPSLSAEPVPAVAALDRALGRTPVRLHHGMDWMVVYEHEEDIRGLDPDMAALARLGEAAGRTARGVIVTAPGREVDFVCRFFAPALGIPEDPVTGSAYCMLAPYWAARLGRCELTARQLSRRGGLVRCTAEGDRVRIAGPAVLYLEGTIHV